MSKITKGTEVWYFTGWNGKATVAVHHYIIQSIGKKQATATRVGDCKFTKHFIYARDYGDIIAVADLPDPTQEALRRAVQYRQDNIAQIVNVTHWYSADDDTTSHLQYLAAMKRECEKVINEAPAFVLR